MNSPLFEKANLIFMIGLLLFVYFSYHAINGKRSYLHLLSLDNLISVQQQELSLVTGERLTLEKRVKMLRTHSLDRDMLEERAIKVLGYAPREQVSLLGN